MLAPAYSIPLVHGWFQTQQLNITLITVTQRWHSKNIKRLAYSHFGPPFHNSIVC
jgi:hypothetical protein